jgi:GAF domain-containing protein
MKQFLKDEKVIVVNPALLPEAAAAEQESCRVMSIKSYNNIPLFLKGTFIGWLGFDSCYQHKDWSDELSLLQSSKEVLLSQIGQVQSYQYLLDSIDLKNLGNTSRIPVTCHH